MGKKVIHHGKEHPQNRNYFISTCGYVDYLNTMEMFYPNLRYTDNKIEVTCKKCLKLLNIKEEIT
jgi:hypothetical protein